MCTIISRFAEKPTSDDKPECIVISAETYKCIEISSFVPTCINIMPSIPSEPTPSYDPWERPTQEPSEAPILSSLETCVANGDTIGVLIENFDPNALYVNLLATNGFLSPPYLYGDTIVWTFDNDISCGETETVEIQVIQMDKTISPIGSYSVVGKCKLDTPILSGTNSATEGDKVIITIDNYDSSMVYTIQSITVGTAEIIGNTIEWKIPAVDITVTGGTIGIVATSNEQCKIPSDTGYHTINIYQDTCSYYPSQIGIQSNVSTYVSNFTVGLAAYSTYSSAYVDTGFVLTRVWSYPSTVMTYEVFRSMLVPLTHSTAMGQGSPPLGVYKNTIISLHCGGRIAYVEKYENIEVYDFTISDTGTTYLIKQQFMVKRYNTYEYTYA